MSVAPAGEPLPGHVRCRGARPELDLMALNKCLSALIHASPSQRALVLAPTGLALCSLQYIAMRISCTFDSQTGGAKIGGDS